MCQFGRERVTFPAVRNPLSAGLTLSDVVLYSSERIFPWRAGNFAPRLMQAILEKLPAIHEVTSPTPVTVQMAGLRIKLPYETYAADVRDLEIEHGIRVRDVADVLPSRMRTYIWVRVKPFSETNVMV